MLHSQKLILYSSAVRSKSFDFIRMLTAARAGSKIHAEDRSDLPAEMISICDGIPPIAVFL